MTLSSKERAALRAEAHHLDPIVHMGHHGLTDALRQTLDDALRTHELVKVALARSTDVSAKDAAHQLAAVVEDERAGDPPLGQPEFQRAAVLGLDAGGAGAGGAAGFQHLRADFRRDIAGRVHELRRDDARGAGGPCGVVERALRPGNAEGVIIRHDPFEWGKARQNRRGAGARNDAAAGAWIGAIRRVPDL